MQLVEQHVIRRSDPRYRVIDEAAFKHKTKGRNILVYTLQVLRGGQSKKGVQWIIQPSGLPIEVKTQQKDIDQVRIVPRNGYYVVEVVYSKELVKAQVDPSFCVAIDLGVTNLAAITSNRVGFIPQLVNGRTLKAINQWYNKRMKELMLCLPKEDRERVTKQMQRITNKRNRRVNHYLHAASKTIIDFLVKQGVGTIIIGKIRSGNKRQAWGDGTIKILSRYRTRALSTCVLTRQRSWVSS